MFCGSRWFPWWGRGAKWAFDRKGCWALCLCKNKITRVSSLVSWTLSSLFPNHRLSEWGHAVKFMAPKLHFFHYPALQNESWIFRNRVRSPSKCFKPCWLQWSKPESLNTDHSFLFTLTSVTLPQMNVHALLLCYTENTSRQWRSCTGRVTEKFKLL